MSKVTARTQSPLNKRNWHCQLKCGHQEWVMGQKPRIGSDVSCSTCPRPNETLLSQAESAYIQFQSEHEFSPMRLKTRRDHQVFILGYLTRAKENKSP